MLTVSDNAGQDVGAVVDWELLTTPPLVGACDPCQATTGVPLAIGGARKTLHYSDHVAGNGPRVLEEACRMGLEGVVSKRADSRYVQERTRTWIKAKCAQVREFVVGGWSDPGGSRAHFGSLLIGEREDGDGLVYRGRVGTGFSARALESLMRTLAPLATRTSPFTNPPKVRQRPELQMRIPTASTITPAITPPRTGNRN